MNEELSREDLVALSCYLVKGRNLKQVHEETGVTRGRMKGLLRRDDVREIMGELKEEFYEELDTLQVTVVETLRDLMGEDRRPEVRLGAVDRWARLNGKFKDGPGSGSGGLTAEDVARALIEGGESKEAEKKEGKADA